MTTISRIACPPRYGTPRTASRPTLGPAVGLVAAQLGKPLMPWQQHVVDVILEIDPDTGRLAYQEFGLTVPRQSGKSTLLLAKAVHRATATKFFGPRQQIVYTAQTRKDARKKWEEDFVEDLKASTVYRSRALSHFGNGNEHVRFTNRSRFGIESTTEKAGHGGTIDEAYIDEAFAQVDSRMEQAFGPAMITRKNKQLGWISTAGWSDSSPYLQDKVRFGRQQVELGIRDGLAYFEWAAAEEADPEDRSGWWEYMPALGHTIDEDAIAGVLAKAKREGKLNDFRRAYMNLWVPKSASEDWLVIPRDQWLALADPDSKAIQRPGEVAFAVEMSWDRTSACIGVCGRREDGLFHVEIPMDADGRSDFRSGPPHWLPPRLKQLVDLWRPARVVVNGKGPAGTLIADIEALGVEVFQPTHVELGQAFGRFRDTVEAGGLRHLNEAALATALAGAASRKVGDAVMWDMKEASTDSAPLIVATNALWGLATAPAPARFFASYR